MKYPGRADMLCPTLNRRFVPTTEVAAVLDRGPVRESGVDSKGWNKDDTAASGT
jgi:hypothetical protein